MHPGAEATAPVSERNTVPPAAARTVVRAERSIAKARSRSATALLTRMPPVLAAPVVRQSISAPPAEWVVRAAPSGVSARLSCTTPSSAITGPAMARVVRQAFQVRTAVPEEASGAARASRQVTPRSFGIQLGAAGVVAPKMATREVEEWEGSAAESGVEAFSP